jgi:transcriptional regulator with XRE-family HTH domain
MRTLQQHMTETGMKDADLADKVGVDRSMIARIRLGYASPSLKVAVAIHEVTGVDMSTMLAKPQEVAE